MKIRRFGVSIEEEFLKKFDDLIKRKGYTTRSKAISDLITQFLSQRLFTKSARTTALITLVYNHHKRELVDRLISTEHSFLKLIVSSQHIHLDDENCLEVIVCRGRPHSLEELFDSLRSIKGVKSASLIPCSTG